MDRNCQNQTRTPNGRYTQAWTDPDLVPDAVRKAAWDRAFRGYISNALLPDSTGWAGEMTVRDLASAAQTYANDMWTVYLEENR